MTKPKSPPAAAPVIDDAEELLTVAGDNTHRLWFYRERSGTWDYLGQESAATVRAPGIREYSRTRWGGGHFRVKLRHVNGTWAQSRMFTIEGDAIVSRHDESKDAAPAAAAAASSLPSWVDKIVLPIGTTLATTLATLLAKKLLEKPETDPVLVKLLERVARAEKGDTIDALELQRLVLEAERRGEERGEKYGALAARRSRDNDGGGAGGVAGAIHELVPVVHKIIDRAGDRARHRVLVRPPLEPGRSSAGESKSEEQVSDAQTVDVPAWLAPFAGYRLKLLQLADSGKHAAAYASMVIDFVEDNEQLLGELAAAHHAGRLEADLRAFAPQLFATPERQQFARQFLEEISAALLEITAPANDTPTDRDTGSGD